MKSRVVVSLSVISAVLVGLAVLQQSRALGGAPPDPAPTPHTPSCFTASGPHRYCILDVPSTTDAEESLLNNANRWGYSLQGIYCSTPGHCQQIFYNPKRK